MPNNKAIELVETRQGCAMMEIEPRYNVLLRGKTVGQLYFNLRGYVGDLPCVNGSKLSMPESSITTFRRQVAVLNKEFANTTVKVEAATLSSPV